MLNWMILYGFIMSFWLRLYHQGRLIVPGNEGAGVAGFARFWLRAWVIGFVMVMGLRAGIPGDGYVQWWQTYSVEHSMVLWFFTTLPLTVALYLVKEITFHVTAKPGGYHWFEKGPPPVHRISMGLTTVWNIVFWAWILLSPTLPFYKCFIRIFLGDAGVSTVFPFV